MYKLKVGRMWHSIWTYGWAAAATFFLAFIFVRQSWDGSASLNDPRAVPRAIAPRGELVAEEKVRLGDVIIAIDGKKVESPNDLFLALENYKIGDSVNLSMRRDGKTVQTRLSLAGVQVDDVPDSTV